MENVLSVGSVLGLIGDREVKKGLASLNVFNNKFRTLFEGVLSYGDSHVMYKHKFHYFAGLEIGRSSSVDDF